MSWLESFYPTFGAVVFWFYIVVIALVVVVKVFDGGEG